MEILEIIKRNNQNHAVDKEELKHLISEAGKIYSENFEGTAYFERSIFINWTCAIADCKYCFLSTKEKHDVRKGTKALRSKESILGEVIICKLLGWKVGYLTGGLRVESTEYLIDLLEKVNLVIGEKTMMNFGPYSRAMVEKFKPHVKGMGSAIESFNEEIHNYICPSKPLSALKRFLFDLQDLKMEKLVTIILGFGEEKEDVDEAIVNIKRYGIEKVQLCFLKPQKKTVFSEVPSPDQDYMAWWIAKIRIACPGVVIKVALVRDRIDDLSLYLSAGANSFSRFMVFSDFSSGYAEQLKEECSKAGRNLQGEFSKLPEINFAKVERELPFDEAMNKKIIIKAEEYWKKLEKLS